MLDTLSLRFDLGNLTIVKQAPRIGDECARGPVANAELPDSRDDTSASASSIADFDSPHSDSESDGDDRSRLGMAYVGSIASTYWRPERTNRGALSAIDERWHICINLRTLWK